MPLSRIHDAGRGELHFESPREHPPSGAEVSSPLSSPGTKRFVALFFQARLLPGTSAGRIISILARSPAGARWRVPTCPKNPNHRRNQFLSSTSGLNGGHNPVA
jgi:hypothetical protein